MSHHVCPWWMGYLLANPLRKILQNPVQIVSPYITTNMKVLDVGCGMGFFTIPMAKLVGDTGIAYGVDMQNRMLKGLKKRAYKNGVIHCIETKLCQQNSLDLEELKTNIEFVLLFAVVHEVPDPERLFKEVFAVLKPKGRVLFTEPTGHVSLDDFERSLQLAISFGFQLIEKPKINNCHSALIGI